MKICILDGYTLNPGDLSWHELAETGDLEVYDRTPENLILERASSAEIVLTNKTPMRKGTIDALPNVKYIGVLATGYDVVDVGAAIERGVVVTNVPNYATTSVAQMVFALLLEFCQRVQRHSDEVMNGAWSRNPDWCFWKFPLVELSGKTMGIVGFGRIGHEVARIATAFGMRVIAYSRTRRDVELPNFDWADLAEVMKESDVVSLHCPLTPETEGLINARNLSFMKSTAIIINTSRGKLINNKDLADALNREWIAGAGVDVMDVEPPTESNPLFQAKNCLITPHISWATKEARGRLLDIAVDNVKAFLEGRPQNIVNPT